MEIVLIIFFVLLIMGATMIFAHLTSTDRKDRKRLEAGESTIQAYFDAGKITRKQKDALLSQTVPSITNMSFFDPVVELNKAIRENAARLSLIEEVESIYKSKKLLKEHTVELLADLEAENISSAVGKQRLQFALNRKAFYDNLVAKYGMEVALNLFNHRYWIGMTKEQLTDLLGQPDKIEKEFSQSKEEEIYIYGTRAEGDIFVIENDEVVKFTDRGASIPSMQTIKEIPEEFSRSRMKGF